MYVWANKDIVDSMNEVKDDLAKPDTGAIVQGEQKRIEEQLQAMIDQLAQRQQKKRFEQKQQGQGNGGQGNPPPRMPTEVELRLLKELQQAVNKSTTNIHNEIKKAAGKKDERKLLNLGNRQGELRGLLDRLLQEASQGKVKLGKEPDNKDQLPEEASVDFVRLTRTNSTLGV